MDNLVDDCLYFRYHLKAMELGTGRQLFPRCLDLIKNGDNQQFSCQVTFSSQVDTFEFRKHI